MRSSRDFLRGLVIFAVVAWATTPLAQEKESESVDPAGISSFGQRGLLHSWTALPYSPGSVAVGTSFEFFKSSDFLVDGDTNQRTALRFVLAGVPLQGLEINAGFSMVINQNTAFAPEQIQNVGDPFLGVRYGLDLADWFGLGLGIQVMMPSGAEYSELAPEGTRTRFLLSMEFRPLPEALILVNAGYHLDLSSEIFDGTLHEAQLFAGEINPHDQLLLGLGFAWQLGPVAPFLEIRSAMALGSDAPGFADNPNWLTIGVRGWPFSHHSLHLMLATDIGLSGMDPPAGKARIPPWNLVAAVGYDFGARPDPEPRVEIREVIKEVPAEAPAAPAPAPKGLVAGQVLDANTGQPLGGARVTVPGKEPRVFLTEPEEGRFSTCPSDPGPVKLTVSLDGYKEETQAVVVSEGPDTPATIKLYPAVGKTFGTVKGIVRAAGGKPIQALVSVPARETKIRSSAKNGRFQMNLATGMFDVLISKQGFITQRRKIKLGSGDLVIINVELYPKQ